MITTLLVANRGEIARRIFRTCRDLGIGTVAVYADPDADAPHTREADAAHHLPGDTPADTYLRADLLVKAALACGADAVHPGYGFLSESPDFARAVIDAGLVWVGPPPEAIAAMASKTRAKELMARAGVPLLAPVAPETATEADLPLLVKAAAGGGGRGMRLVRELDALPGELAAASAEASAAFGDGEVFAEPYVERGRHVEVQVLADAHGTVWVLGTRDCSLQRRHQKVIEEAPAPALPDPLRTALHTAATEAATAIDYRGAGTVEFLVSPQGRGYFLEMNTRLQVEHPVTECVHGIDLVAWQLRIAEGHPLPTTPPEPTGHAVEARLYAEDPARDWQPQTGRIHRLDVQVAGARGTGGQVAGGPGAAGPAAGRPGAGMQVAGGPGAGAQVAGGWGAGGPAAGVRVDSGFGAGDTIGIHYDPMLAKVIAWAPTRAEAIRRLAHTLERARLHGPATNRELLVRTLRHPEFGAAEQDTGFFERHLATLTAPPDEAGTRLAALAAALADGCGRSRFGAWRNVPSQPQSKTFRSEPDGTPYEVRYRLDRTGLTAEGLPGVHLLSATPEEVVLAVDGVRRCFRVAGYEGGAVYVDVPPLPGHVAAGGAGGRGGSGPAGGAGATGGSRVGGTGGSGAAGGAGGSGGNGGPVGIGGPGGSEDRAGNGGRVGSGAGPNAPYPQTAAYAFTLLPRFPDPTARTEPGSLLAPMPGTVARVADVAVGDAVRAGQPLLWLEAMKMEHKITAPAAGTLTGLHVAPGQQVEVGALLAVLSDEQ